MNKKKILKGNNALYLLSLLAVLIIYQFSYGLNTINPKNISWLMSVYHDWGQHYLGWAFYRNDPWQFPLGNMSSFYYPVGTNAGFTDSIPLLALIFKPFSALLPDDFQYLGLWLLSCHLLLAYYSIKIFKLFDIKPIIIFLAVIIICANPVLIFRGMHPALCAHWLILASIYHYLKKSKIENVSRINRNQIIVFLISATVNPYLATMVAVFNIAIPFKHYFYEKTISIIQFILFPLISFASGLIFWIVFGLIEFNNSTNLNAGYIDGAYGFNLNSFFNSYGHYSRYIPQLGMVTDKQYEGFGYLGLGELIIVAISLFYISYYLFKKDFFKKVSYLTPLLIAITGLLIFSISNFVSLGKEIILVYPLPVFIEKLAGIFRAIGRFSWPFYYFLIVSSFIIISKIRVNNYVKIIILGSLTFLQFYDTSNLLTARQLQSGEYHTKLQDEKWKKVFTHFDKIITYPAYTNNLVYNMDYQDLMFLALKTNKPITNGYVARENITKSQAYRDTLTNGLKRGEIEKSELYITNSKHIDDFKVLLYKNKVTLKKMDGFIFIYSNEVNIKNAFVETIDNKKYVDSLYKGYQRNGKLEPLAIKWNTVENIQFYTESYSFVEDVMQISGWAFDKSTNNNSKDSIFIAISNNGKSYLFPTTRVSRGDITTVFKKENLEASGYTTTIFTDKLPKANYEVGIVIKSKNSAYHYAKTDLLTSVGNKSFKIPVLLEVIPPEKSIISNLESVVIEKNHVKINGWAAIKDQNSENTKIEIVLLSKDKKYVLESDMIIRHDVTSSFKNLHNYDFSGFTLKFKKKTLPSGNYKIGVIITDNKNKKACFKLFDKTVSY